MTRREWNRILFKKGLRNCPKGYHVDHIIPLQGKEIRGFHVEYNLQYLLSKDNLKKSNKLVQVGG